MVAKIGVKFFVIGMLVDCVAGWECPLILVCGMIIGIGVDLCEASRM